MLGTIAPYLMAFSAMAFAGVSALTLIYTISHLDPPEIEAPRARRPPTVDILEKIAV